MTADFRWIMTNWCERPDRHRRCLEVNNSSLNPQSSRQGGRENITELLKTCMKYDQPVIMGTDSHMCFAIGTFDDAEQLMRELEFPTELVLNYDPENIRKLINITL